MVCAHVEMLSPDLASWRWFVTAWCCFRTGCKWTSRIVSLCSGWLMFSTCLGLARGKPCLPAERTKPKGDMLFALCHNETRLIGERAIQKWEQTAAQMDEAAAHLTAFFGCLPRTYDGTGSCELHWIERSAALLSMGARELRNAGVSRAGREFHQECLQHASRSSWQKKRSCCKKDPVGPTICVCVAVSPQSFCNKRKDVSGTSAGWSVSEYTFTVASPGMILEWPLQGQYMWENKAVWKCRREKTEKSKERTLSAVVRRCPPVSAAPGPPFDLSAEDLSAKGLW